MVHGCQQPHYSLLIASRVSALLAEIKDIPLRSVLHRRRRGTNNPRLFTFGLLKLLIEPP